MIRPPLSHDERRLSFLLLAAFAARAFAGALSLGADHPNETYRLLEPLAAGWGFSARLPWEWTEGLLSTLPVKAHALALTPVIALTSSPMAWLIALKMAYSLLSLFPILATWTLLRPRGAAVALTGAMFVAFWPEFIYRSVRLMDYSLEADFLAIALLFTPLDRERAYRFFLSGVALGLAFFVRFQSGLYLVALLLALLTWRKSEEPRSTRALALLAGYGVTVFSLAAWETHLTHAAFLSPFVHYIRFNWVENGAARFYGTAPWHRYLSESLKAYGFLPFVIFILAAVCALLRGDHTGRRLGFVFFLPLLALSLTAHKEGRFAFGFLWVLVPAAFSVAGFFSKAAWKKKPSALATLALVGIIGFALNAERVSRRFFTHAREVKEWSAIGEALERMPADRRPTGLIVKADPDAVPGGFFLRFHGALCYEYDFGGKAQKIGPCDALPSPNWAVLEKNADSNRWELIFLPAKGI